jgi:hypothetical protein
LAETTAVSSKEPTTLTASATRVRLRLLLFAVVALASVATGFLAFDVNHARYWVKYGGYYTITFTFAWALIAVSRIGLAIKSEAARATVRERWQAGAVIVASTAIAILTVPITYKVLYDEMVLQATAWHMHYFREISTVLRAYPIDGVFMPFDAYLDKRPFFFAYTVSLLHDLFGYHEANAFYLNMALTPVVLGQIYLIGRRVASHAGTIVALVSIGAFSLLAENATGAGMEMLNLAMLLGTMQMALWYLDAPDEKRLSALILTAVLLAQTRYESSLYVVPAAIAALEGWRRAGRVILPPAAIFAPALLIPYAVHNTYLSGTPLLWELHENEKTRFGLEHFLPNIEHAATYLFSTTRMLTNSLWLSVVGPIALLFGAIVMWRSRRHWRAAPPAPIVLLVFGAVILGNLLMLMFYYWGQLDDPIVARLILPTCVLMALTLAYAVDRFGSVRLRVAWVAAGGAVFAYVWGGVVANAQHTGLNTLDRELLWERRFVATRPPGDRLIITNKSALPWMLCEIPAVAVEQARHRGSALQFHLDNHTFREVLVFQKYRPTDAEGDYQLDAGDRLPDSFVLEPITERRFGTRLDRVSRLVQVRAEHSPSAAK